MNRSPSKRTDDLPAASLGRRVGWIALAGVWVFLVVALASFDVADPPSHVVAVHNQPVENLCGWVGATIAYWAYDVFGIGVWIALASIGVYLAVTVTGRVVEHPLVRLVGVVLMMFAAAGLHGVVLPGVGPLAGAEEGLIGIFAATELAIRTGLVGATLILLLVFLLGMVVAMDEIVLALPRWATRAGRSLGVLRYLGGLRRLNPMPLFRRFHLRPAILKRPKTAMIGSSTNGNWASTPQGPIDPDAGGVGATDSFDPKEHLIDHPPEEAQPAENESKSTSRLSKDELRSKIAKLPVRMTGSSKTVARDEDIPRPASFEGYRFPTLDLLEDPETNFSQKMEKFVRQQAETLENALQTFKIDGEVVGIESGPAVTLFAVQLAPGTKVSKVNAISSDIARSMRAQNIRIVPNMAGKTSIGIEVPNLHKEKVRLKELMSGGQSEQMKLPMFLGKDAAGEPLVADLARMPHMLIAGTTGSGKSVCMNTIIMSWLYTKRPDELKLVLVDPKIVELSQFQDIPHLMCPVVTEMSRAASILEWAVNKMEERYELLKEAAVRDVDSYNQLSEEELYDRFQPANEVEKAKIPKKLPYMVFIIDELADLIMTNKEVESSIVRIAQKARAVGIHLIVATQRPQANVVTGLIKSNMPCRVSFKVASGMDSRIVLDQKGAELLLGQGDMLYLTPHTSELDRAQGTLVTDIEIRRVAKFLKSVAEPSFERSLLAIRPESEQSEAVGPTERDEMFDQAVEIMIETGRGSVSLLQRRLAVGYSRASRLVDQMSQAGILGDHKGSVAREVLITMDDWEEMKAMEEAGEADGTLFEADEESYGEFDEDDEDDEDAFDDETDELEEDDEDEEVPAEFADEYRG